METNQWIYGCYDQVDPGWRDGIILRMCCVTRERNTIPASWPAFWIIYNIYNGLIKTQQEGLVALVYIQYMGRSYMIVKI